MAIALAAAGHAVAQDVDIVVRQIGVGSMYRPGEVAGMQLELTSGMPEPMQVWVQWDMPNADGDIAGIGRSLALTPGRATQVWLYAPLPPPPRSVTNNTIWTVRVFEERDGRPRAELAATRISPGLASSNSVPIESGMIGVVGTNLMSLDDYDVSSISGLPRPESMHEATRVVRGITPAQLPDRWEGLKMFEAIAWSNADPQLLRADQAIAIRQWIQHGGHLIIALPQIGDPWSLGITGRNELDELLPARSLDKIPRRDEGVMLSSLLPIFSKSRSLREGQDLRLSLRVFKEVSGSLDVLDNFYEPLIATPDGRVFVVQRTYGFGRVTVIGLDISQQITSIGLPHADVFWNRILGRVCDTPTPGEVRAAENDQRLAKSTPTTVLAGSGIAIEQAIALSGEASRALLLALVLFCAYWLLAGPLGFAVLKKQKLAHHSWVAFLAATVVFTAIAWGSVSLMRLDDYSVKHVTYLDYVARPEGDRGEADPQMARAVSWVSVYLNKYGPVRLGLTPTPEQRNLLYSWQTPRRDTQPFPNVARYLVDVGRDPTVFDISARSTTTQLYANWLGPLDTRWGGMITASIENPIKVEVIGNRERTLAGTLTHNLPGSLTNVMIIWIENQRIEPARYARDGDIEQPWIALGDSGRMLNVASAWSVPRWDPNTPFDLNTQLFTTQTGSARATSLRIAFDTKYIEPYRNRMSMAVDANPSPEETHRYFEMLSFYSQLPPPTYITAKEKTDEPVVAIERDIGREIDLSAWFNRPCLIVMGRLQNSATPLPLLIEGEAHESTGMTIVRWIYPLPVQERIAFPNTSGPPEARAP